MMEDENEANRKWTCNLSVDRSKDQRLENVNE